MDGVWNEEIEVCLEGGGRDRVNGLDRTIDLLCCNPFPLICKKDEGIWFLNQSLNFFANVSKLCCYPRNTKCSIVRTGAQSERMAVSPSDWWRRCPTRTRWVKWSLNSTPTWWMIKSIFAANYLAWCLHTMQSQNWKLDSCQFPFAVCVIRVIWMRIVVVVLAGEPPDEIWRNLSSRNIFYPCQSSN